MGRRTHAKELAVWINGRRAAEWRIPARGDQELQYSGAWVKAAEGRPLSLSLPFSLDHAPVKGPAVERYFENLLPDSDVIRQRIKARYGTESSSAFDLLVAIGRDCVGAVQLLPPGDEPKNVKSIEAEPLSDVEIEAALQDATASHMLGSRSEDDFRISLAGAQEKTAFLKHRGKWCRPRGATPTTHIFKLPLGIIGGIRADMSASLENEWLCAKILRAYGIPSANCELARFGNQKALVVERFDRREHASGKYWLRLVQEDFCQAHGLPPSMKYEADGGPGILEIANILRRSENRDADLATFLKAQIVFWMLAAGDGHAKNFSLHVLSGGRYRLTPLYDVISYHPIIGNGPHKISRRAVKVAMALRGKSKHYLLKDIQRRHFNRTAAQMGFGSSAEPVIGDILGRSASVIAEVGKALPRGFPSEVADPVLGGLAAASKRLGAMGAA